MSTRAPAHEPRGDVNTNRDGSEPGGITAVARAVTTSAASGFVPSGLRLPSMRTIGAMPAESRSSVPPLSSITLTSFSTCCTWEGLPAVTDMVGSLQTWDALRDAAGAVAGGNPPDSPSL